MTGQRLLVVKIYYGDDVDRLSNVQVAVGCFLEFEFLTPCFLFSYIVILTPAEPDVAFASGLEFPDASLCRCSPPLPTPFVIKSVYHMVRAVYQQCGCNPITFGSRTRGFRSADIRPSGFSG